MTVGPGTRAGSISRPPMTPIWIIGVAVAIAAPIALFVDGEVAVSVFAVIADLGAQLCVYFANLRQAR
ncbi:hypothetical protein [Nocardia salmonicida]|uniref:hypothetical protein n=1 Tax=Nocardia salmonicida TaxID=53431 RepID=UPI003CF44053